MDASRLLRTARRRSGLSLRQLAARAGTSDATLSAYETGRVTPRTDTLTRVIAATGWVLAPTLERAPARDPRRAPAGEELWQAMLLAEALPQRPRPDRPQSPHAVFGRA